MGLLGKRIKLSGGKSANDVKVKETVINFL